MSDARRARFESEALAHAPALYSAACRLAGGEDAARDLTQETLLRAYRTFDGFTPGTNARAWLLTILYSVFINGYRQRARAPKQVSIDEVEARFGIEIAAPPMALPDPFAAPWTESEVSVAMAELPEPFRDAIMLVDVEGLTYEEAAVAMACAVGTVRSRLFRARRVLSMALGDFARRRRVTAGKADSR